ncbi:unnamed protein product [Psylliodes chrysocephalus]|uniref:Uncharacterized protein n=1 Tax=Psylliodes chrysocephalus TaxID=3402493 RepID=A0A9P0CP66_9CUCU|nr:unnamed protein product [Psylliodes chrysocephala]
MYLVWLCFLVIIIGCYGQFEIPPLTLEAFTPSGLKASLPANNGIEMFAFHGKINKEFKQFEPGDFTEDIMEPVNGFFVYDNPNLQIKVGDVIYYWIFVQHDQLGYRLDNQTWHVKELKVRQIVTSCGPTVTNVNGPAVKCKGDIIFEDDFNGSSLDSRKWMLEQYIPTFPDFEFNIYNKESAITSLQNDRLTIRPKMRTEDLYEEWLDLTEGCTQPISSRTTKCRSKLFIIQHPIASGKIVSTAKFSYGEVEVRAKLPAGDWMYPQIYLEDENNKKIVIAYARGNTVLRGNENMDLGGSLLFGGPIIDSKEPSRSSNLKSIKKSQPLSNDFHTYRIKWTPQEIELFLDGDRYGLISADILESTGFGNDSSKVHLALGVGVGGITDFPDNYQAGYPKPWRNRETQQMYKFLEAKDKWLPSWNSGGLLQVEYVKIRAI